MKNYILLELLGHKDARLVYVNLDTVTHVLEEYTLRSPGSKLCLTDGTKLVVKKDIHSLAEAIARRGE
jgi:hypothetical protein